MRTSLIAVVAASALTVSAYAKSEDAEKRLDQSATALSEMMQASDKGIPQELIDKAQCVVVVPNLKKGAFVVGGKYGKGFVMCRNKSGAGWSAPAAIKVEGGSFGFQFGGAETDVIMLVMNESGVNRLLKTQFTMGGEAAVAAGPLGRDGSAQTDAGMKAEILSYSRSRGAFAGLSLQGATLRQDNDTNEELYGKKLDNKEILTGGVKAPASAARLQSALNRNSMHKDKS